VESCTATTGGLAELGCYCPAYLSSGLGCSSCLATLQPSYASVLGLQVTACSTACYNECSSLYLLNCHNVASCYCPVYQASAAACSACVADVFPTYAAGIASILTTHCSGEFTAGVTGTAAPTANPAVPFQTQTLTQQTSPSTHSGARSGFEGMAGEYYIAIIMTIAAVASFWSVFM
jgi:hypothetical protein